MVRALVIADEEANLHVQALRDLAPDLVLCAGDLPWDYIEYVASASTCPVVFVPGNHDPEIERSRRAATALHRAGHAVRRSATPRRDQRRPAGRRGRRPAHRRPRRVRALQAGAAPVHPAPVPRRARRLLRRARRGGPVDVLLTHAPPSGSATARTGRTWASRPCTRVLDRLEPTWHLHGHIHPYGQQMPDRQVGPTTIRNVIPWKVLDIEPRSPHRWRIAAHRSGRMGPW